MTSIGVLQIAIFFGLILVCTKPLGAFMATRVRRTAHLPASGSPVARSTHLQAHRREGGSGAALDPIHGRAAELQPLRLPADLPAAARTGLSALQSSALQRGQCSSGPGVQHRDQLRHQHQLAGVLRRIDHELFRADGRPGGAELRFGGRRHRDCGRAYPRVRPAGKEDHRQLLGGRHSRDRIRAAADLDRGWPAVRLAGRRFRISNRTPK